MTDIHIPPQVEKVAALGPKFNLIKTKLEQKDRIEIVKNVENIMYKVPEKNKNKIRNTVVEQCILEKNKKTPHVEHHIKTLNHQIDTTKKFAKQHNIMKKAFIVTK